MANMYIDGLDLAINSDFVIETDSPEGSQYMRTVKIYNEIKVK